MIAYISKYPTNHITCNIHRDYMYKKYGFTFISAEQTKFEDFLEKLEESIQTVLNKTINPLLHKMKRSRTVFVKIDRSDTWSMDETLAHIILPMLIQLKRTKQGAPIVDSQDVPKELRPTTTDVLKYKEVGETDENFFKRWEYVLDEMIWAFNQQTLDDPEGRFYDHSECDDGPLESMISKMKVDEKGLDAYHKRKTNGFRLFGKYYQSLWD